MRLQSPPLFQRWVDCSTVALNAALPTFQLMQCNVCERCAKTDKYKSMTRAMMAHKQQQLIGNEFSDVFVYRTSCCFYICAICHVANRLQCLCLTAPHNLRFSRHRLTMYFATVSTAYGVFRPTVVVGTVDVTNVTVDRRSVRTVSLVRAFTRHFPSDAVIDKFFRRQ